MTLVLDDPDLGRISLRPVALEEQRSILADVAAVDLDRGERVFRAAQGRDFRPLTTAERWAPNVHAQIAEIRRTLQIHAVVRAGVVDPTPPALDAAIVAAYPAALGMYIRLGDAWTEAVVRRLYDVITGRSKVRAATGVASRRLPRPADGPGARSVAA